MKPLTTYSAVVGAIIYVIRKDKGLHQAEVSRMMKVSQAAYSKIERGMTTISTEHLSVIADELGTSPAKIIYGADSVVEHMRAIGIEVSSFRIAKDDDRVIRMIGRESILKIAHSISNAQ